MGPTEGLPGPGTSKSPLLSEAESEVEGDELEDTSEQILYTASFDELAENSLKYDTIIWMSISLLLVLAWGVGIIMLLYLPFKRYVLRRDISSRKLHVTPSQIIYKVSRPSYIPFWGPVTVEKQVPLSLVIDIIIEQGCLQSVYGIHTFRIESIALGKAAPVDELQVQGVSNPGLLRKVIITEAAKVLQEVGTGLKPRALTGEVESVVRMTSLTEGSALLLRSPSKSLKATFYDYDMQMTGSPRHTPGDRRGIIPGDLLLNKLEEVSKSVKKLEFLVEKSQACLGSSS